MHILITGASRGIGKALAIELIHTYQKQLTLSLLARGDDYEDIYRLAKLHASTVKTYKLDVMDYNALESTINNIYDELELDLIIVNAGISCSKDEYMLESIAEINRCIDTNTKAAMHCIYLGSKLFLKHKRFGQIAAISSLAGFLNMPGSPSYCASKAALNTYLKSLMADKSKSKYVKYTLICPGFVKTDMSDRFEGQKLMMLPVDKAAKIICKGIFKKKSFIIFPYSLYILIRLLNLLPFFIYKQFSYFTSFSVKQEK